MTLNCQRALKPSNESLMEIRYYVKHVYGVPTRYPADAMSTDLFRVFRPDRKTIQADDIKAGETLGLQFKEVIMPAEAR